MAHLPVIDFSPFTAATAAGAHSQWSGAGGAASLAAAQRDVATRTHEAFSAFGFCYAAGHGVDPGLLSRVLAAADAFFALPEAEKEPIAVERSPSRSRGWQRLGQNVTQGQNDAHEGFDIMRELPRDHRLVVDAPPIHHSDCNQWPAAQPELRSVLEEYVAAMSAAGAAIMRAVAMGLGLPPEFFERFYSEGFWIARMIRYPAAAEASGGAAGAAAPAQTEKQRDREAGRQTGRETAAEGTTMDLGCGEHTDYGCLTLVAADSTPGCLQVRGPDGSCE